MAIQVKKLDHIDFNDPIAMIEDGNDPKELVRQYGNWVELLYEDYIAVQHCYEELTDAYINAVCRFCEIHDLPKYTIINQLMTQPDKVEEFLATLISRVYCGEDLVIDIGKFTKKSAK